MALSIFFSASLHARRVALFMSRVPTLPKKSLELQTFFKGDESRGIFDIAFNNFFLFLSLSFSLSLSQIVVK